MKDSLMKLSEFEKALEPQMAERGYNFWLSQAIADLVKLDEHNWQANVWGSVTYEVNIEIIDDKIISWRCNCPYDWGNVCKHTVATMYAIRNRVIDSAFTQPKTRKQEIIEIIDENSKDDLAEFIKDYAIKNKEFFLVFLAKFGKQLHKDKLKQYYSQFIKENARIYSRDDDFIDREESLKFIRPIEKLLQKAEVYKKDKEYGLAVPIYLGVIEELVELLVDTDDSVGRLGDTIKDAFELLHSIAITTDEAVLRKKIYEYCEFEMLEPKYINWGYEQNFEKILKSINEVNESFTK
jgi:uncharacterized Zn finger protein